MSRWPATSSRSHARARTLVEEAEREAEELLATARATGQAIVAGAEGDAAAVREEAALDRQAARNLLADAKRFVAQARERTRAASRNAVEMPPTGEPPATALPSAPPPEPIELNQATMEDLRVVGLSITQARRVIAQRDRGGSYASVDELAELPGMPAELLDRITPHLRV